LFNVCCLLLLVACYSCDSLVNYIGFVKNLPLPITNKFAYLGSTLSNSVSIDDEINNRIAKASAAFGRLRKTVWNRRGITLETKMKVYRAVVLPTLLYGCETWTVYSRHARKLNHFHTTRLRSIMNIKWHQRIPDTAVLTRAMTTSIHTMLMKHQARWAGHIVRMEDDRIPKRLFYGELSEGKRSQGGQKKRYKDSLKVSLKTLQIDTSTWENAAMDRSKWRSGLSIGATAAEKRRMAEAEEKRCKRKDFTTSNPPNTPLHMCPICKRLFQARIGLISHRRTHRNLT